MGPRINRREVMHAGVALGLLPGALARASGRLERRAIPSTGESLPVIGLGTARTFDVGEDARARGRLREVLMTLAAGGARVVDTSPMYGSAEAVLGALLADMPDRQRLFMATKVWTRGRQQGIEQMQRSMALLNGQQIDLMQIHNLLDWRTHLATLRAWKAEGRFRYLGISHYLVAAFDEVARVLRAEPLDFLQINYSMLTPEAERNLLPMAADRGVAIIVNRPFENGELFRRVRGHVLPPWASEAGMATWAQFFLKFILAHPAVTCVIPATSNPRNMLDNLQAGHGELPDQALRRRMRAHVLGL